VWWSWALSSIGLLSLWQITKFDRKGFLTGLAVEVLWLWYAFDSKQWGFLPAAFVYGWFYWHGWRKWSKVEDKLEHIEDDLQEEVAVEEETGFYVGDSVYTPSSFLPGVVVRVYPDRRGYMLYRVQWSDDLTPSHGVYREKHLELARLLS